MILISGYILTEGKGKNGRRYTRKCLENIHNQLKKKEINLVINHTNIEIGQLVSASLDKRGLKAGFVLDPNHKDYFKTLSAISLNIFDGLSVMSRVTSARKKGKISYIDDANLIHVGLVKTPSIDGCYLFKESKEAVKLHFLNILTKFTGGVNGS